MRIFCAIRHSNDPRNFYGGLWSANFYPALRELGHEIVESKVDLFPTSRFMDVADGFTGDEQEVRARTTEQILEEVRREHGRAPVHLFLSYFYNAHFDPTGFAELRRLDIPSVNFYCNSLHQFGLVRAIAAKADFAWHPERDARSSYLAVGANPVWVQMAADPNVYHPVAGMDRLSRACFIGQRYADRDRWLASLVRVGVPVDIYGAGWGASENVPAAPTSAESAYLGRKRANAGSISSYVRMAKDMIRASGVQAAVRRLLHQMEYRGTTRLNGRLLSSSAKGRAMDIATVAGAYELFLNFSNVWADGRPGSPLIPHVRLRDFEGPMCRACYLTGHTDEITEFYDVGREIETYSSHEELVEKARFYLSHPAAAERLREAGHRRALRDHTWQRRFELLFSKIGLRSSEGKPA